MNFNKLKIIIQREYITRVRTKAFIITTLLAPILMTAILVVPMLLMIFSSDRERTFPVHDESGVILERMMQESPGSYKTTEDVSSEELRRRVISGDLEGYVFISSGILEDNVPPDFFHDGSAGFSVTNTVRNDIRNAVRDEKLDRAQAGPEIKQIMTQSLSLNTRTLSSSGEEEQDSGILFGIGYFMAFAIYFALFTYGSLVMRGVIEEKTSRVVEVMASCVKPFELLLGKVLGIGAVGLTQFIIWIAAGAALLALAVPVMSLFGSFSATPDMGMEAAGAAELPFTIPTIGFSLWLGFIAFFLLGYLTYSSIFAAIGSAVDSETDTQQLMIPVIFLLVIPIMILGKVASDPTSTFAVVTSMVPFFAPILMPVRMAVIDLPLWQLLGSLLLCTFTFLLIIWLSARIYRVGILMYGKKPTLREMARWIRYS
ncbi:MAG: ABC transporter permease [Balneolales bacterium]